MRAAALFLLLWGAAAVGAELPPDGERWPAVRESLFGARALREDDGARLTLNLPARAHDAATVPLAIEARALPGEAALRRLYLVVDKNPSPVGAVFEFGDGRRRVALETRIRIEDYTWVRLIAEQADGTLHVTRHYIKAAGGCSAPAGKSLAERMAGVGEMRWRLRDTMAQLQIRHPNNSGLAMDQLTRLYDPPYFVRDVTVTLDGQTVFSARVDFTISENPSFRFSLPEGAGGELRAVVVDTDERVFESAVAVTAQ